MDAAGNTVKDLIWIWIVAVALVVVGSVVGQIYGFMAYKPNGEHEIVLNPIVKDTLATVGDFCDYFFGGQRRR